MGGSLEHSANGFESCRRTRGKRADQKVASHEQTAGGSQPGVPADSGDNSGRIGFKIIESDT